MELIKAKLMDFIVCWAAGGYMILLYSSEILYNMKFEVFLVFYMCPCLLLGYVIGAQRLALGGETSLQEKNSTGRRWDSNPGPCFVCFCCAFSSLCSRPQ